MKDKQIQLTNAFDFGYCPIVFTANNNECACIWKKAKEETEAKYPDFTAHSWRVSGNNKLKLVFSQDNYHDALLYFWKNLETTAGTKWLELQKYFTELSSEEISELNLLVSNK